MRVGRDAQYSYRLSADEQVCRHGHEGRTATDAATHGEPVTCVGCMIDWKRGSVCGQDKKGSRTLKVKSRLRSSLSQSKSVEVGQPDSKQCRTLDNSSRRCSASRYYPVSQQGEKAL